MIVFDLRCGNGHVFEAWFASGEAFESQNAGGMVCCPLCDDCAIMKAVMAPAVPAKSNAGSNSGNDGERKSQLAKLAAMQAEVESRCDYVGRSFASEARARHDASEARARHRAEPAAEGDAPRGIFGETSLAEARALIEDGIPVAPLPFRSRRAADA